MERVDSPGMTQGLEALRNELWACVGPPFATETESAEWIEGEHDRGLTPERSAGLERLLALFRELDERARDADLEHWLEPVGVSLQIDVNVEHVVYRASREVRSRYATTPRLKRLAEGARAIADHLGCTRQAAVALVGVGAYPTGEVRSTVLRSGPLGSSAHLALRVGSAGGKAYPRDAQPTLQVPSLTPRDKALLDAVRHVQAEGHTMPPPARRGQNLGVGDFWTRVMEVVNAGHHPKGLRWPRYEPFAQWHSVQRRFKALVNQYGPDVAVFW